MTDVSAKNEDIGIVLLAKAINATIAVKDLDL